MADLTSPEMPWARDSFILGNLAVGNVRENLQRCLTIDGRVHAETLLTVAGALTGHAAQHAALLAAEEMTGRAGSVGMPDLALAKTRSGDRFLMGDLINLHLVWSQGAKMPLYGLIAGAALRAGVKEEDLPDWREIIRHVMGTFGTPDFNVLRLPPGLAPTLSPIAAVRQFLPFLTRILRLPAPNDMAKGEAPLSEQHWPAILSMATSQFLTRTKDVVSPKSAANLIMEAAWIASRVHPDAIQPGAWLTVADAGRLKITRGSFAPKQAE